MNNKTTWLLASIVVIIFAVIGVGFITSQSSEQPKEQPAKTREELPTASELTLLLQKEQAAIDSSITASFPQISTLYTIERGKLYHKGEWYGAILQYKGSESANRDTLRIVMQQKAGIWVLRTSQPQPLVSKQDIPNAPVSMLDDINRPAPLTGTETSPAITPSE